MENLNSKGASITNSAVFYYITFLIFAITAFFSVIFIARFFEKKSAITGSNNGGVDDIGNYFNEENRGVWESELLIESDPFKEICKSTATMGAKTTIYSNTVCINE